jgi:non-ribosomal peptide synthetase component F
MIGFFINTVVLRLRLRGDPTFRTLLQRSRETAVSCYAHQELPFEQLVQAIRPKRRSDRNPLFQVNLRVQGPEPPLPELTGMKVSLLRGVGFASSRFDLAVGFTDTPGNLSGYIEFNSALFDRTTVERWIVGLLRLLDMAAENPDVHLSELAAPVRKAASR